MKQKRVDYDLFMQNQDDMNMVIIWVKDKKCFYSWCQISINMKCELAYCTITVSMWKALFFFPCWLYEYKREFSFAWMTSYSDRTTKMIGRQSDNWVNDRYFLPFCWKRTIECELIKVWCAIECWIPVIGFTLVT